MFAAHLKCADDELGRLPIHDIERLAEVASALAGPCAVNAINSGNDSLIGVAERLVDLDTLAAWPSPLQGGLWRWPRRPGDGARPPAGMPGQLQYRSKEAIMKSNFVILRTHSAATRDIFGRPALSPAGLAVQQHAIRVEVDRLERRDLATLANDASVVAIAPAMPMRLIHPVRREPATAAAATQAWGIGAVGADRSPRTGSGIVVAVLDTGIDAGHDAFQNVRLVQKDFTGQGDGDGNGHGTHCAGTIFGGDVAGMRIGVARGVKKALIGKVLDADGGGSSDQIVSAILWAADEGAHVISMSLGMDFGAWVKQMIEEENLPPELATSRALEGYRANTRLFDTLSDHVKARGLTTQATVIVAAAGNESRRDLNSDFEIGVSPPAISEGIISVAALGQGSAGLSTASFSNTGANLSAPGVDIVSAAAGGTLRSMSGTSMATPHVAGVAALWAEQLLERGRLDAFSLIGKLAGTASSTLLAQGFDPFDVGAGLVQSPRE